MVSSRLFSICLVVISFEQYLCYRVPSTRAFATDFFALNAGFGSPKSIKENTKIFQPTDESICACGTGLLYEACCKKYHTMVSYPSNTVDMVRSRYSALIYRNVSYVMETTHPSHKDYSSLEQKSKRKVWEKDLLAFANEFDFSSLTFKLDEDIKDDGEKSTISFSYKAKKVNSDRPPEVVKEISSFLRLNGKWLYSGELLIIYVATFLLNLCRWSC